MLLPLVCQAAEFENRNVGYKSSRMKKIAITIALLLVTAIIICVLYFGVFSVTSVNQKTYDFIKSIRQESEYFPLKELTVNGETAYESIFDSWWLCSLPEDTDFNKLGFSFERDRLTLKLAVLKQDFSKEAIEQNQEIKLLAYSPRYYREYSLHVTTLPIFTLNTATGYPLGNEPAFFNGLSATVHIRGATTRCHQKPGYKITLDEKASFLGMREDDDWVLYAGYNDQERVRNVFSSNLWYNSCAGNNSFGIVNGYEYRYIELFFNGKYAGLYALGYKPDQKQFEIQEGEFLFSKVQNVENAFELRGGKTKSNESAAWQALSNDYIDDELSVTDLWLFIYFCAAGDNTDMNYYLALKSNENGHAAVYCPWDLDLTWGNKYNHLLPNSVDPYANRTDIVLPIEGRTFDIGIHKLVNSGDADTIKRLKSRYTELRQNEWSDESISNMIFEYEDIIFNTGAYRRDISRWPESTQMADPNEKLSYFHNYVFSRIAWMDKMIDEL